MQESAAPALRVGELHPRNELLCQERDAKCRITDLYNALESRKGLERKPNFAEDALSGPPQGCQEILEEKEFRLVPIVALCQILLTPTICTSLDN